ncbi:MAG: heparinase II/III family protein [Phycisphaerales bacterium]|nr:heparinase II/III family protein [Phycisphaerales bacterium]
MEFAGIKNYVPSPNSVCTVFSPLATMEVTKEHPRLFGSRSYLQGLAKERPDAYRRTKEIANRDLTKPPHPADAVKDFGAQISVESKLFSMGLVAAIEEDAVMGRKAVEFVFEHFVNQPVRVGHIPFGADVGCVAIVYDLCNEHWTAEEKRKFEAYMFECRDKNVDEESSPFHDGWWGYKNWGIVLGTLALMGESEKEMFPLFNIDREYRRFAAECQQVSGDGGGYPEGFYVNYYMFHWLLACEAMKRCTGADWMAEAPAYYKQRAIASMFEQYPTIRERGSRRMICVGDGRGRFFKVERDAIMTASQMLAGYYKDDPNHQAVKAFLELTPHVGADENAYRELLWFDPKVKKGNLKRYKLSHVSKGPGYVYGRSSWEEDATYFFFKCGKRFTAHQHIDVGHFYIFKHEELATEGGHYAGFGDHHDINYYMRTISHNSMLIHDPDEKFTFVRGYPGETYNDGGQAYPWPGTCFRHNGDACDMDNWRRHPELGDIADLLAFQEGGTFMYTAGDCTRSYSSKKLEHFTRQIVFVRPGTFVIFDRVKSKKASFKKTWLLHAAKEPTGSGKNLQVTHGKGRLHVQSLLPAEVDVKLNQGEALYKYGVEGQDTPAKSTYGPTAECRIEISPSKPAKEDFFLHVLTATDAGVESVPEAVAQVKNGKVVVTIGKTRVTFLTDKVGGSIEIKGKKTAFVNKV